MLKKILFTLISICILHGLHAQSGQKKVLFIIVDGIPADVIEKIHTPHLDQIASVGGYTRAYVGGAKGSYSESPTISAVGYHSLLTGTWVNKHNVWGNDIKAPNYHYWSIFRLLESQYPEKRSAVFSTWLDNRTKLIGEGLAETGHLQLDYHFDGFELDTLRFPHDADRKFIHHIDELVVDETAQYVKDKGPDLSWVYLEYPDDMGHRYGDSEQMYQAVAIADEQIGKIWTSIQYRQQHFDEDWLMIITTDHGRDEKTGHDHGGQSDRERTIWMITNASDLNQHFTEAQPGIVSILPTIARFMDINIPKNQSMEIDGVPLIGKISLADFETNVTNHEIRLSWKAMEKEGQVKVWLALTNHFEDGGIDQYRLVGEVPVEEEQFSIDINQLPSPLYKIVLEGLHNTVNRWVVPEEN